MTDGASLVDRFTARLASAGGTAYHVATSAEAAQRIAGLTGVPGTAWAAPVVRDRAPGFTAALTSAGYNVRFDGDPASVRDQPLGITIARNTIAETGSSLLVEPTLTDRSPSLMTQVLIVLCATGDLLPGLDEAAPVLREISLDTASYATFVTGPSRTADIERQLTVGVQGPAALHVILVDELS